MTTALRPHKNCKNIELQSDHLEPFKLTDAITNDGSKQDIESSWPKGTISLTGQYPASIEFMLWRDKPGPGTPPDLRFTVRFEHDLEISSGSQKWVNYFRGSQEAMAIAGAALAEAAKNPHDYTARDRAIKASRRLQALGKAQKKLPRLNKEMNREIQKYVTGKELQSGYAYFARRASVLSDFRTIRGYEALIAEYKKPHWKTLRSIGIKMAKEQQKRSK